MSEIDADELHHLDFIFFLGLGASPSISFLFLKIQARRTSSSFTKPSTHLQARVGVPLVGGKLIPSPIYPYCPRFESHEALLEHFHY